MPRHPIQFGENAVHPAGLIHLAADMGIEIAIRTLGGAERPMNVDAEAHGADPHLSFPYPGPREARPEYKLQRESIF
jgi:hypothetical protein